jgi:hypothetical protein
MWGIGHDLERQRRERLLGERGLRVISRASPLRRRAGDRREVERRRHVVADGVEQRLDALVLERRAVEHRHDAVVDAGLADAARISSGGDLLVAEELLHDVLVVSESTSMSPGGTRRPARPCRRGCRRRPRGAELFALPDPGLHLTRSTMPR